MIRSSEAAESSADNHRWLVKSDDVSVFGKYPGSRSVEDLLNNGIIILDKWCGPTSHDISGTIKKILGITKSGHVGTLDPMVSGVLPILLGNACKVTSVMQNIDKEYVGIAHLHKDVDQDLNIPIKKFVGLISQMPPVRSAVARKERLRRVYSFDILDRSGKDFVFRIHCDAGTYIRKIISDLGKELGGAHMSELRRIRAGRFRSEHCVKIQDVVKAYADWKECGDDRIREMILPVEAAIEHIGKIIVKDSAVYSIAHGLPLYTGGICRVEDGINPNNDVAILTLTGELVALGSAKMTSKEMLRRKGMAAKVNKVVMIGSYPKIKE